MKKNVVTTTQEGIPQDTDDVCSAAGRIYQALTTGEISIHQARSQLLALRLMVDTVKIRLVAHHVVGNPRAVSLFEED